MHNNLRISFEQLFSLFPATTVIVVVFLARTKLIGFTIASNSDGNLTIEGCAATIASKSGFINKAMAYLPPQQKPT